jgi:hypothetical protein
MVITHDCAVRWLATAGNNFPAGITKASAESRPMPLEHPVIKIDFMMIAFLIGFRFCAVSLGV